MLVEEGASQLETLGVHQGVCHIHEGARHAMNVVQKATLPENALKTQIEVYKKHISISHSASLPGTHWVQEFLITQGDL